MSQPKSRLDLWIPWYVVNTLYQRRNCLIVFIPSKISLDTLIPFPSRLPCYSFVLFIQVSVLFACILSSKRFSAEIILWYAPGVTLYSSCISRILDCVTYDFSDVNANQIKCHTVLEKVKKSVCMPCVLCAVQRSVRMR